MSIELNKRGALVNEIIKYRLEHGEMPTSADILQMIADENIVRSSSNPTVTPPSMLDGQTLSSAYINELADGVELDLLSMRATLSEAWVTLGNVLDNTVMALPVVEKEAELVENVAIRALALTPHADAVRVGEQAINVSAGIGFGSVDGADMDLSSGIEIDLAAGALTLERSAVSVLSSTAGSWSADGEYNIVVDKTIGTPSWLTNSNTGQTWTVAVSSPSKYGRVSINTHFTLVNPKAPLKRVEMMLPDYVDTDVFIYVDSDGSGQYSFWERGAGKGRIVIDGAAVHAKKVRVVFSRYVSGGSFFAQSRPRHAFTFQISEVVFASSAYAPTGNIVTDPIEMSVNNVMSTVVDVDAVIPSTAYINVYLARDVESPTSISDFMWIPVDADTSVVELSRISHEITTITATAPVKIRTGAGVYSNSIYSIGEIDGLAVRVEEGYGQVEVRPKTVYYVDEEDYPAVNAVSYTGVTPAVSNHRSISLSGGNYNKVSTSIWADVASSHALDISFTDVDEYIVLLNGVNITSRMTDGQMSASFVAGKNDLVIYTKGEVSASPTVSIPEIPGCVVAIDRPNIVQETALITSENRVAQSGNSVLVNHDPTGRVFRLAIKKSTGGKVDSVRLRVELIRGLGGETPQIKSAYITTGV